MAIIGTGQEMVDFAYSKLGTPYVYGAKLQEGPLTQNKVNIMAKMYPNVVNGKYLLKIKEKQLIGKVCVDCSGLVAGFTNKMLGSSQLYSKAKRKLPFRDFRDFAPGVVLWRSGHVGIYTGKGSDGAYHVVEAKGIDWGTIDSLVTDKSRWSYGLTFDYIDYVYDKTLPDERPKSKNPYKEPVTTVKFGAIGDGTRWVQMELIEAGFGQPFVYNGVRYAGVAVDGEFGRITDAAVKAFQSSSKIVVDGKVGPATRKAFKLDDVA